MKNSSLLLLTDKEYILEKFPGKGGWTYIFIPEVPRDKKWPFGMLKVRGTIDDHELKNISLMPMGHGKMFLPVNATIRKSIGKAAGDKVHLLLCSDHLPEVTDDEFLLCLEDDPPARETFFNLTEKEKKEITDWIFSAGSDEVKVKRMAEALDKLSRGKGIVFSA